MDPNGVTRRTANPNNQSQPRPGLGSCLLGTASSLRPHQSRCSQPHIEIIPRFMILGRNNIPATPSIPLPRYGMCLSRDTDTWRTADSLATLLGGSAAKRSSPGVAVLEWDPYSARCLGFV